MTEKRFKQDHNRVCVWNFYCTNPLRQNNILFNLLHESFCCLTVLRTFRMRTIWSRSDCIDGNILLLSVSVHIGWLFWFPKQTWRSTATNRVMSNNFTSGLCVWNKSFICSRFRFALSWSVFFTCFFWSSAANLADGHIKSTFARSTSEATSMTSLCSRK